MRKGQSLAPIEIEVCFVCPFIGGYDMCGIVGYVGQNNAKDILLEGLKRLEYRGYDSAGIAIRNADGIQMTKVKGRVAELENRLQPNMVGTLGIGHTRWATHGEPSIINAHPHFSQNGRFCMVHNGVIENYSQLKNEYLSGTSLISKTDTEIIVQLMEKMYEKLNDVEEAFRETMRLLNGSYAIAMIDAEDMSNLYVSKNKSPLLIGVGDGFHVVTSDAIATIKETNRYVDIQDKEIAFISSDRVAIKKLNGESIERTGFEVELDSSEIEKGSYAHYMLKEIDEQPIVIRRILEKYQGENEDILIDPNIRIGMNQADRIYIIAAGTSYHAGLVGKGYLEKLAGIPTEVHIASEFNYNMPLLSENPFFLFISQSGETADSRAVLVQIKRMGFPTMTITNVPGSTLSREADFTLPLYAGPEIAVASTKAYTAQLAVLALLAADIAIYKGLKLDFNFKQEMAIVANAIETLCDQKDRFRELSQEYFTNTRNAFFIGRSADYYVAMEGALKLKEISYIQAEGFAGGELKHGTIALIEDGTPVIALVTQNNVDGLIRGNVQEVVARGAHPMVISIEGQEEKGDTCTIPAVHEILSPLVSVVPLQLLAYYAALQRNCDVDKPRNLAKSVTVE